MLEQTWAIVLAAGLSSRMGACKPLLPLGGSTVLGQVLRMLRRGGTAQAVVVLGHRADEIRPQALAGGAMPVPNPRFQEGMLSSIQAGVAALPPECPAFFLLPADIPLVRPATLAILARAMSQRGLLAAIPTHAGRRGHPPLISSALAGEILGWDKPGGLRALLAGHGQRVAEVPVEDPGILQDMDDPEQYQAVCRAWRDPND